jgi:DNA uptake protein ComE-like DNA-binding protein
MKLNYKDFNEMSDKQLRKLPGVGRTTTIRIVANRPFRSNDDLFKVKGLGRKTLKRARYRKD